MQVYVLESISNEFCLCLRSCTREWSRASRNDRGVGARAATACCELDFNKWVVADTGPDRAERVESTHKRENFVPSEKILVRRHSLLHVNDSVFSCCRSPRKIALFLVVHLKSDTYYTYMHTYIYTNTHTRMRYFIYIRINQVRHYTYYIHWIALAYKITFIS